jgi:hypothetical protein
MRSPALGSLFRSVTEAYERRVNTREYGATSRGRARELRSDDSIRLNTAVDRKMNSRKRSSCPKVSLSCVRCHAETLGPSSGDQFSAKGLHRVCQYLSACSSSTTTTVLTVPTVIQRHVTRPLRYTAHLRDSIAANSIQRTAPTPTRPKNRPSKHYRLVLATASPVDEYFFHRLYLLELRLDHTVGHRRHHRPSAIFEAVLSMPRRRFPQRLSTPHR